MQNIKEEQESESSVTSLRVRNIFSYPKKKSYDQPRQHIKSRDITLPTKVHLVKAVVFPVVIYECDSWTIKKTERQRIDAQVFLPGETPWTEDPGGLQSVGSQKSWDMTEGTEHRTAHSIFGAE